MRKCGYCGRENAENANVCQECGTSFFSNEKKEKGPFSPTISNRFKWTFYFAAWIAVVLATFIRNPADLRWAPVFPIGLLGILSTQSAIVIAWFAGLFVSIIGWLIYVALTILLRRTNRLSFFLLIYLLLCILLALNVVGCGRTLNAASHIH
jgi:hypothetical protein